MKIESIDKYPKKINDEIVEFSIEQPMGPYDPLWKAEALKDSGFLIGEGIMKIRKRYGSIISVNKKSYWALTLFSRYSRRRNKKNYSVPSMIDLLITDMRDTYFKESMNDNKLHSLRHDDSPLGGASTDSKALMKYFKRVFVYGDIDSGEGWQPGFPDEVGSVEIFLPEYTYHEIPKLRELLIGILEPELFDASEAFSHSPYFNNEVGHFDNTSKEHIDRLPSLLKNFSQSLEDEIRLNIDIARNELEHMIDEAKGNKARKKSLDDLGLFINMSDKDIQEYIKQYNCLLELAPRLGKYI